MIDYLRASQYILQRLKSELPKHLYYHSVEHAIDVCEAAERLAINENINEHDKTLVKTAALYHDSGHVKTYVGHELHSIQIVKDVLPTFGYTDMDIEKICSMIFSTQIPQNPTNLLEEILCDADLDYFGRDDFFMLAPRLYCEWKMNGISMSLKEWHFQQIQFIEQHNYFTKSAYNLRNEKKQLHLQQIKDLMNISY